MLKKKDLSQPRKSFSPPRINYPNFETGLITIDIKGKVVRVSLGVGINGEMLVKEEEGKIFEVFRELKFATLANPEKQHYVQSEVFNEEEYLASEEYAETGVSFYDYIGLKMEDLFTSCRFPGIFANQKFALLGLLRTKIKPPSEANPEQYDADNFFTVFLQYKEGKCIGTLYWRNGVTKLPIAYFKAKYSHVDAQTGKDVYVVIEPSETEETIEINEANLDKYHRRFPYSTSGKILGYPDKLYQEELERLKEVMDDKFHESPENPLSHVTKEQLEQYTYLSTKGSLTKAEKAELKVLEKLGVTI